jgi:cell division protein FtsB
MSRMFQDDVSTPEPAAAPAPRARRKSRPAHEVRERNRRLITWALLLGSFILVVNALFGERGYLAAMRAQQEYRTVADEAARLQAENARIQEEIRAIKSDPDALEGAARRELGLIKPGETLIIVRDARPASTPAPPK